jgi:enoyl-[acyl-carrier protein] reductase I
VRGRGSIQKAGTLEGKKSLIIGIVNDKSIVYGCAKAFKFLGVGDLAVTYLKEKAKSYVQQLAEEVGANIFMLLDAQNGDL